MDGKSDQRKIKNEKNNDHNSNNKKKQTTFVCDATFFLSAVGKLHYL